jgi:hypothetical protein
VRTSGRTQSPLVMIRNAKAWCFLLQERPNLSVNPSSSLLVESRLDRAVAEEASPETHVMEILTEVLSIIAVTHRVGSNHLKPASESHSKRC